MLGGFRMDNDKLVTLNSYRSVIDAHIDKTKLESEGIECFLENEDMNWLYSGVIEVNLQVSETDFEKAREILDI